MRVNSKLFQDKARCVCFALLVMTFCALMYWPVSAHADALTDLLTAGAGAAASPVVATGNVLLDVLLGTLLPPLFSVVIQSHWPTTAKKNISWILCFVIAVGVSSFQQHQALTLTLQGFGEYVLWVLIHFGTLLTVASQTFDKFWQPSGVAPAIMAKTDIKPLVAPAPATSKPAANVLDETPATETEPAPVSGDFNIGGAVDIPFTPQPMVSAQPASTPPAPTDHKVDLKDEVKNQIISAVVGGIAAKLEDKIAH